MCGMKKFKVSVLLQILFSILPWFDMGDITPAYSGIGKMEYMGVPFLYVIYLLWAESNKSKIHCMVIGEMSFMFILAIQVNAFFNCRKLMWIDNLTDWNSCIDVTLPTFWICIVLSIINVALFPFIYLKENK